MLIGEFFCGRMTFLGGGRSCMYVILVFGSSD